MKKEAKILGVVLLLLMFVFPETTFAQGKAKLMKPTNYTNRVKIEIGGKTRSYYSLDAQKESVVKLNGPGILKLITRAHFANQKDNEAEYEIVYSLNNGKEKRLIVESGKPSRKASYPEGVLGIPGASKSFEIRIPIGNNNVGFKLLKNNKPVAVRYVFRKINEKVDWIEYCPREFDGVFDIITNETLSTYYRFSNEKPLKAEVIGPTRIRVFTRIGYDYHMQGYVNYRIQVKEDGKLINTYQLNSRQSDVSIFKTLKDLTPAKANEFVIYVPKGKHTYEIIPMENGNPGIFSRLWIVKGDVSNTE